MTYNFARACPECAQRFTTTNADQLFCTPAHKAAFHNRNSSRGRGGAVQLLLAWRASRNRKGGSATGSRAFRELCLAADAMIRDDREAGRDAIAYLEARWRAEGTMPTVSLKPPTTARKTPAPPKALTRNPTKTISAQRDPIFRNEGVRCSSHLSGTTFPEHR
jgi:hypothetical protein